MSAGFLHISGQYPSQCLGTGEGLGMEHMRGQATDLHGSIALLLPARLTPTSSALGLQALISSAHCYSSVHLNILILGEVGGLESSMFPPFPDHFPLLIC